MKPLFILTSALNTKFGVYNTEQRMAQTIDSVNSIKKYCPEAKIAIIEMAGTPPTEDQLTAFYLHTNYVFNYSLDENVQTIYHSTENWDIVKNTTEVMVFANALEALMAQGEIAKFDRIFKMSGRYQLTERFDPAYYDSDTVNNSIVVLERKNSQFTLQVTGGMQYQYMSRLWSWPAGITGNIVEAYNTGLTAMATRIHEGGYFDIEHMLYAYLPKNLVVEKPHVGLRGLLGPNGVAIED